VTEFAPDAQGVLTSGGPRSGAAGSPRPRATRAGLLLCLVCVLVYSLNMREIGSLDTVPTRLLPVALFLEHRLTLDSFFRDHPPERPLPYWVQYVGGHYRSSYPVLPALLAVPVYVVAWSLFGDASWARISALAKLSAALIAAVSVLFVYLGIRQFDRETSALGIALVYAFGTSTWSVSSQSLWGHGPAQLFLAVALYATLRGETERRYFGLAGLATGLMMASRPTTVIVGAALLAYALHRDRRWGVTSLLLCAAVTAPVLAYNVLAFGSLQGGYAWLNATHRSFHGVDGPWSTSLGEGLLGLLLSPSRGLFVYSPVLVFAIVGLALSRNDRRRRLFGFLAVALGASIVMLASWSVWWGGHSYGPRLLTDFLPVLTLFLVPVWNRLDRSRPLRVGFLALLIASLWIQAIGAFYYPSPRDRDWNKTPRDVDFAHERLWDWRDPQIVRLLANGPHPVWRPSSGAR